ncbi:MAG: porin, partial [Chlorobiaceae bacterium]|nr:porin [Chlorobiaceae bacterium]
MKKMLSLAAMFAVLAYASPASAEIKFGGDASVRLRGQFEDEQLGYYGSYENNEDDLNFAYRLRLKASADLGSGYFFKALITSDNAAGGWNTVKDNNSEDGEIDISNLYFGRMMENSHYMMGRLPLNSMNNPIFDLALYPIPTAVGITGGKTIGIGDIPVATYNMDRIFGLNYGAKIGSGELNATLIVLDNDAADNNGSGEGDGLFNDGYGLHLSYKATLGNVTVEPQAIIALTNVDGLVYENVTPYIFGANVTIPAGKAKIGLSGFYTACDDNGKYTVGGAPADVDYSGYLLRLKGEYGPFMAWVDYNNTNDKTNSGDINYDNLFVWAQYNFKVYESAMGTFSLTPIVRYWAAGKDYNDGGQND